MLLFRTQQRIWLFFSVFSSFVAIVSLLILDILQHICMPNLLLRFLFSISGRSGFICTRGTDNQIDRYFDGFVHGTEIQWGKENERERVHRLVFFPFICFRWNFFFVCVCVPFDKRPKRNGGLRFDAKIGACVIVRCVHTFCNMYVFPAMFGIQWHHSIAEK